MHVISKKKLRMFWKMYPTAEAPLKAWFKKSTKAEWDDFHDVKEMFPQTDQYKGYAIFDIGGNKYRLIAEINYARGKVLNCAPGAGPVTYSLLGHARSRRHASDPSVLFC